MEYILKVTPKGQVTLPKKLRNQLAIQSLLSIHLEEGLGILKKTERDSDVLAGSFHSYYRRNKIPLKKARKEALRLTVREMAKKNN
jgi:AbrB family looped-hinge helix DNA binding protein